MLPKASCYVHDLTGEKISFLRRIYTFRQNVGGSERVELDRAREQLHACVKWDLVDHDFFSFFATLCANISASNR